mgnify:CR=1 FL=1
MWIIKIFKTRTQMLAWLERNENRVQYVEVFVNNAYAVEYRKLRQIG